MTLTSLWCGVTCMCACVCVCVCVCVLCTCFAFICLFSAALISFQNTMRMNGGLFSLWFACLFVAGLKKKQKKNYLSSARISVLFLSLLLNLVLLVFFPQMLDIIYCFICLSVVVVNSYNLSSCVSVSFFCLPLPLFALLFR